MRRGFRRIRRHLVVEVSGTEIAEAAVVLPLLFMVLIGIFWFGQAFRIYGAITRAAQEGARAAAAPTCSTCTALTTTGRSTNAFNAIQNVLSTSRLSSAPLNRGTVPTLLSCLPGGTAPTCDTSRSSVCIQYDAQLSDTTRGGAGVCGISVSFQYPYQFWLPFTSLNQQRIQIPAAARVREETQ